MTKNKYIDEFYKVLSSEDHLKDENVSIKNIFEAKINQYGLTQNQAEKLLKMEKRTLEGILNKSLKRVDIINLLKLGHFLDLNTDTLMKIYIKEQPTEKINELENAQKKTFIVSNFDIRNLFKSGFLKSKTDYNKIEERIVKFFGLKDIFEYSHLNYIPAFSRTKKSTNMLMREFWVRSAYSLFEKINNPNDYNRDKFVDLVPKIKPYTRNTSSGLKIVAQALYNIGVTIVYQPHVTTTQVRGATFIVNGKPCIVITDLNKNYTTLWFALMHEIYHVLYDYDEILKQKFHLTGENDLFLLQEDKADEFSREYLFSDEHLKYISPFIDSPLIVNEYAKERQIHPAIIYIFYCWEMDKKGIKNVWGKYKQFRLDSQVALVDFNANTLTKESIDETVKYLKEKVFNF